MLKIAFKEWAAVCGALADGTQTVILRKGGIAEVGGEFKPEHARFWLYPTHYHEQHRKGIQPEAMRYLDAAEAEPRTPGTIRFAHYVDVADVVFVNDLDAALSLAEWHIWTPETVEQRFRYRTPGLYVLAVRVYAVPEIAVPELPTYEGCKTWVELDRELPDEGTPVLSDAEFARRLTAIRERLTPRP
ncbi:MAG: DUF1802 family protein [Gemmataceae bacterium]|nr:DUF1802 family protein [Gemmataceae bacterium]